MEKEQKIDRRKKQNKAQEAIDKDIAIARRVMNNFKGDTQIALANALGISKQAWHNFIIGKNSMSLDILCKAADITGCSVDELIGRSHSDQGCDVNYIMDQTGLSKRTVELLNESQFNHITKVLVDFFSFMLSECSIIPDAKDDRSEAQRVYKENESTDAMQFVFELSKAIQDKNWAVQMEDGFPVDEEEVEKAIHVLHENGYEANKRTEMHEIHRSRANEIMSRMVERFMNEKGVDRKYCTELADADLHSMLLAFGASKLTRIRKDVGKTNYEEESK